VLSSTVVAKTAVDADMLATCMFVLETERGVELIGGLGGVKVFVIGNDGRFLN